MPRACIFCGKRALSREHIIPEWAKLVIANHPKGYPAETNAVRLTSEGHRSEWPSPQGPDAKARCVSKQCNNGWMGGIETAALTSLTRMIRGEEVTLTPADQESISSWIALKAVVGRYFGHGAPPPLERRWLDNLYVDHMCPDEWVIWLAAYEGSLPIYFDCHTVSDRSTRRGSVESAPTDRADDFGVVATLIIGNLAMKLVGLRAGTLAYPGEDCMMAIHPATGAEQRWPPPNIVMDNSVIALGDMFLSEPSSIGGFLPRT